jgi:DNA-binding response OmpR family regulator
MIKKILLLEDDPQMRDIVAQTTSKLGYEVLSAATWLEAREKLEHEPVDALIVDVSFDHGAGVRALGYFEAKYGDSKALVITRSVKDEGPHIDWAKTITAWAA